MKTKTIFIILGIFLLLAGVGVGIYFYLKPQTPKDKKGDTANPAVGGASTGTNASSINSGSSSSASSTASSSSATSNTNQPSELKELQKGSTGAEVKTLQELINKTMNAVRAVSPSNVPAAIGEDGNFGAKTESALLFCTDKKSITLFDYTKAVLDVAKGPRMGLTPQQKQAMAQSVGGANTTFNPWAGV